MYTNAMCVYWDDVHWWFLIRRHILLGIEARKENEREETLVKGIMIF